MTSERVCPICREPFARTDAVVYLRAEDLLLHRACCDRHSTCRCSVSPTRPTPDAGAAREARAEATAPA